MTPYISDMPVYTSNQSFLCDCEWVIRQVSVRHISVIQNINKNSSIQSIKAVILEDVKLDEKTQKTL